MISRASCGIGIRRRSLARLHRGCVSTTTRTRGGRRAHQVDRGWLHDVELYPFSSRVTLNEAISDSTLTRTGPNLPKDQINYIRNSVKAVVDAYDGTVNLYGWDESDPVLKTWEKVFPGVVKAKSEMPADILPHVRYPEDAFKIQRMMFSRYHVTDPAVFYSGRISGTFRSTRRTPKRTSCSRRTTCSCRCRSKQSRGSR